MGGLGLPTANGPAVFLATTVFSIGFALISWKLLEQPINSWKRLFPYPWAVRALAGARPSGPSAWRGERVVSRP